MKNKYFLPSIIIVLMILSFLTGVIASDFLLVTNDKTPSTDININIGSGATSELSAPKTDIAVFATPALPELEALAYTKSPAAPAPAVSSRNLASVIPLANPSANVSDSEGVWSGETEIEIFKAEYDNASGKTTVKSVYGDKVIAPGTQNSYYFNVNNTGDTGIRYSLETEATVSFVYKGERYNIPMYARLRDDKGNYLLGSDDTYADMERLDGIKCDGNLVAGYHTKYILDWQWPYEQGNDEYDTFLGNLSADGDELKVTVKIKITASEDESATDGNPPTGDRSNTWVFVLLLVVSFVALIILLVTARDNDESENKGKHRKQKA